MSDVLAQVIEERRAAGDLAIVPDPGGRLTAAAAKHAAAHQELARLAALAVIGLTPRRARNRLRRLRAIEAILRKTEHVHAEDVPCQETRARLLGPVRTALGQLAHLPPAPGRRRAPIPPTSEPPLRNSHPLARDPRVGRIIEGPLDAGPAAPPRTDVSLAELPTVLRPMLLAFEGQFAVRVFDSLRVNHADRLARLLLDLPPGERKDALARVLYRLAMRSAR